MQGAVCSKCKGLYSKGYKVRHQLICGQDSSVLPVSVSVANTSNPLLKNVNPKFKAEVLDGLRNGKIGRLVKKDQIILTIGEWLFSRVKGRRDKKQDVYDSVRSVMRRLGRLIKITQQICSFAKTLKYLNGLLKFILAATKKSRNQD